MAKQHKWQLVSTVTRDFECIIFRGPWRGEYRLCHWECVSFESFQVQWLTEVLPSFSIQPGWIQLVALSCLWSQCTRLFTFWVKIGPCELSREAATISIFGTTEILISQIKKDMIALLFRFSGTIKTFINWIKCLLYTCSLSIIILVSSMVLIIVKNLTNYTIYAKICGHPFKWVDLAISATPIADRCITSSTQPCNPIS